MKKIIPAILILFSLQAKAQKADTIMVKEKFVYVQVSKYQHPKKVKCEYIIKVDGKYFVNGRELKLLRSDSENTAKNEQSASDK